MDNWCKPVTGGGDAGGPGRGEEEDERLCEGGAAAAEGDRAGHEGPEREGEGARAGEGEVSQLANFMYESFLFFCPEKGSL